MYITVSSNIVVTILMLYCFYRAIVSTGDYFSVKKELKLINTLYFSLQNTKLKSKLNTARRHMITYGILSVVLVAIHVVISL